MKFFDDVSQAEQKRESIEERKRELARERKKKGNKRTISSMLSQKGGSKALAIVDFAEFPPHPSFLLLCMASQAAMK
eukprot:1158938-Pelagomonas_calceolata.AAC.4